jgi:hypothetical protein
VRIRAAGVASGGTVLVVTAVLLGGQLLGGTASGSGLQPRPAVATISSTAADDADDADEECTAEACGNEHSRAVRAWVACKAEKGKDACPKPAPPGLALGHTEHGNGGGRAHAPGQLKAKDRHEAKDADADDRAP